jgi:hypothetical protein
VGRFRQLRVGLAALIVAGIAAVLVFGACGGDDDDGDGADGSPTSSRTAPRTSTGGTASAGGSAVPGATAVTAEQIADAEAVLTAIAAGEQVPEATAAAAHTAIAAATQLPNAEGTVRSTPEAFDTPVPGSRARLAIDADPTDSGPCNTIDDTRTVPRGTEFQVVICLDAAESPPTSGALTSLTLQLSYGPNLLAVARPDDGSTDLNGNPDFLEGPAVGGSDWDCNALDDPISAPRAEPSPTLLVCTTTDFAPNETASGAVPLASLTLTALDSGQSEMAFGDVTGVLGGERGIVESLCMNDDIACDPATIVVQ